MKLKITISTDQQFIGLEFDQEQPIILNDAAYVPDSIIELPNDMVRYANSNYVFDCVRISE